MFFQSDDVKETPRSLLDLSQTLEPREDGKPWDVDTLPIWNFDGSSTGQAPGDNSDVYLRPCAVYPDPFRKGNNILYVHCSLNLGFIAFLGANAADALFCTVF